jgi:hypothetical protein
MNNYRKFKLRCTGTNTRHTKFTLFDASGANCGAICIETTDVVLLIGRDFQGDLDWNGFVPEPLKEIPTKPTP